MTILYFVLLDDFYIAISLYCTFEALNYSEIASVPNNLGEEKRAGTYQRKESIWKYKKPIKNCLFCLLIPNTTIFALHHHQAIYILY